MQPLRNVFQMKLTQEVLKKINTPSIRHELAGILHCTEQTVIRYIHRNADNGPLTTVAAITLIEVMTGLPTDRIIDRNPKTTIA